jgi:hypothetical protein
VTINVFIDTKKTGYIHKTSIEELIRHADGIIREVKYYLHIFLLYFRLFIQYRFTDKSRGWMSIELISKTKNSRKILFDIFF